jgi:hypothetical protein
MSRFFEEIFDLPSVFLGAEQESAVIFYRSLRDYSQKWLKILSLSRGIHLVGVIFNSQNSKNTLKKTDWVVLSIHSRLIL